MNVTSTRHFEMSERTLVCDQFVMMFVFVPTEKTHRKHPRRRDRRQSQNKPRRRMSSPTLSASSPSPAKKKMRRGKIFPPILLWRESKQMLNQQAAQQMALRRSCPHARRRLTHMVVALVASVAGAAHSISSWHAGSLRLCGRQGSATSLRGGEDKNGGIEENHDEKWGRAYGKPAIQWSDWPHTASSGSFGGDTLEVRESKRRRFADHGGAPDIRGLESTETSKGQELRVETSATSGGEKDGVGQGPEQNRENENATLSTKHRDKVPSEMLSRAQIYRRLARIERKVLLLEVRSQKLQEMSGIFEDGDMGNERAHARHSENEDSERDALSKRCVDDGGTEEEAGEIDSRRWLKQASRKIDALLQQRHRLERLVVQMEEEEETLDEQSGQVPWATCEKCGKERITTRLLDASAAFMCGDTVTWANTIAGQAINCSYPQELESEHTEAIAEDVYRQGRVARRHRLLLPLHGISYHVHHGGGYSVSSLLHSGVDPDAAMEDADGREALPGSAVSPAGGQGSGEPVCILRHLRALLVKASARSHARNKRANPRGRSWRPPHLRPATPPPPRLPPILASEIDAGRHPTLLVMSQRFDRLLLADFSTASALAGASDAVSPALLLRRAPQQTEPRRSRFAPGQFQRFDAAGSPRDDCGSLVSACQQVDAWGDASAREIFQHALAEELFRGPLEIDLGAWALANANRSTAADATAGNTSVKMNSSTDTGLRNGTSASRNDGAIHPSSSSTPTMLRQGRVAHDDNITCARSGISPAGRDGGNHLPRPRRGWGGAGGKWAKAARSTVLRDLMHLERVGASLGACQLRKEGQEERASAAGNVTAPAALPVEPELAWVLEIERNVDSGRVGTATLAFVSLVDSGDSCVNNRGIARVLRLLAAARRADCADIALQALLARDLVICRGAVTDEAPDKGGRRGRRPWRVAEQEVLAWVNGVLLAYVQDASTSTAAGLSDALTQLQVLRTMGVRPDRSTFLLLIELCGRTIDSDDSHASPIFAGLLEALDVARLAQESGVTPDLEMCEALFECARLWWLTGKARRVLAAVDGSAGEGGHAGLRLQQPLAKNLSGIFAGRRGGAGDGDRNTYWDGGVATEVVVESFGMLARSAPLLGHSGNASGNASSCHQAMLHLSQVTPSRDTIEGLLHAAPSLLDKFFVYARWVDYLLARVNPARLGEEEAETELQRPGAKEKDIHVGANGGPVKKNEGSRKGDGIRQYFGDVQVVEHTNGTEGGSELAIAPQFVAAVVAGDLEDDAEDPGADAEVMLSGAGSVWK